ncbi:STN domain-containing protein [Vicingaceae bacterium]|nr:STN domain-containing protein [Vicingaceae bacterium]
MIGVGTRTGKNVVDQEFDNYLTLLRSLLRLNGRQRDRIGHELRDHMESRLDELMAEGKSRQAAIRIALEEFGDATAVASTFATMAHLQRRKWIMRFTTFSVVGLFVATLFVMSIWPERGQVGPGGKTVAQDDDPFSSTKPGLDSPFSPASAGQPPVKTQTRIATKALKSEQDRNQDIEKILDQPVSFDYDDVSFSDMVDEMRIKFQFEIVVDGSSGLTEDDSVTVRMRNVRFRTFLDLLLAPYDTTFTIVDGILVICATDACPMETKVFDCRSLIVAIEKYEAENQTPVDLLLGGKSHGLDAISGGKTNKTDHVQENKDNNNDNDDEEFTNPLVKVIKQVSPHDWNDDGATIQSIGGMLIVNQRRSMVKKVENLLAELESRLVQK